MSCDPVKGETSQKVPLPLSTRLLTTLFLSAIRPVGARQGVCGGDDTKNHDQGPGEVNNMAWGIHEWTHGWPSRHAGRQAGGPGKRDTPALAWPPSPPTSLQCPLGDFAAVDAQPGAVVGGHLDLIIGPDDEVLQQQVVDVSIRDVLKLVPNR